MGVLDVVVSLASCIVMMSGCVICASCLSSSCLYVMPLMFTCSMDVSVSRDVLIGLCGVFLVVGASFVLRACVGITQMLVLMSVDTYFS